jgi:hypothetical protein
MRPGGKVKLQKTLSGSRLQKQKARPPYYGSLPAGVLGFRRAPKPTGRMTTTSIRTDVVRNSLSINGRVTRLITCCIICGANLGRLNPLLVIRPRLLRAAVCLELSDEPPLGQLPAQKRLNLGCGRDVRPNWVNLDRVSLPGVDVVHDI